MPSHSSSRGNFSSGGSRGGFSGGFSSGGFRSSGGSAGPRPPRRPIHFMFFGRPVVLSTGSQSGFGFGIVLFVIMFFVAMLTGFSANNVAIKLNEETKPVYENLKTESNFYTEMIEKAEDNETGYGITNAYFKGVAMGYYNSQYVYNVDHKVPGAYEYITDLSSLPVFYIIYEFEVNNETYKGETFAQYSSSDINAFSGDATQRTLEIVYHYDGEKMLSINRAYKEADNFELKEAEVYVEDGEDNVKVSRTICIVASIIGGITILIMILAFVKTVKKSKQQEVEAKEEKEYQRQEAEDAKKKKYCIHCGSQVADDETKCPSCGSSKFERK